MRTSALVIPRDCMNATMRLKPAPSPECAWCCTKFGQQCSWHTGPALAVRWTVHGFCCSCPSRSNCITPTTLYQRSALQINALQAQNQRLMAHVGEVEAHKGMLTGQVTTLRSKWSNATNDNMRLQAEVGTLRKTLQVCLTRLAADFIAAFVHIKLLLTMWPPCARPSQR